jgi:glycosyltransferase involved in cell wall biosynthesis
VGVSRFVAESAIVQGGCGRERVYAVVNGIEPDRWDPGLDGSTVRREFNISEDTIVFSIIARMFVWKGHLDLIRALHLVRQKVGNFRLLIVGEDDVRGAPGRPPLSHELRLLSDQLDLGRHVTFAGVRSDIPQILAATDVFTMPSFEEPLGVAYLEAMAMAKPVVALRSGGAPEAVIHGETGLLSEPGDIAAYAQHVVQLSRDAELRRQMGMSGRARVERYLNARRMAGEMEDVYRTVLAGRQHAGAA